MINIKKSRAGSIGIKAIALVMTLAVLCTVTAVAAANVGCYVELKDNETVKKIFTMKTDASEIAAEAGVKLDENDYLDLGDFIPGADSAIEIVRPKFIGVNDDGIQTVYFNFAGKVGEAIKFAGVTINANDHVNYNSADDVRDRMIISVARAFPVTVVYRGEPRSAELAVGTVADALAAVGVVLEDTDVVSISTDDPLVSGMRIFVDKVVYKERTETEKIAFEKTTEKTSKLYVGQTKVSQKGVDGERTIVYKDKYVNGELADTETVSNEVTKKPVTQITLKGTKKHSVSKTIKANSDPLSPLAVPSGISFSNGVPTGYKKIISGKATAYTGGGTTSTGRPAAMGYVAVDPDIIPYGSKLYIVSDDGVVYGYCIAADTGGDMRNGRFLVDLYMDSASMCYTWGVRSVNVYVLG